jgi:drug/metabolite transporter (DMT)-like permease
LQALDPLGIALAVLCSVVIAVQAVWARRVMPGHDPTAVTCVACAWGALPLIVLSAVNGGVAPLLAVPPSAMLLLLYLGVGCTATNFALYNDVLKRVPAERASAFQYLIPLISALLSFAFLGEPITWPLVVGGLAIVGGIALAHERVSSRAPALAAGPAAPGQATAPDPY